MIISHPIFLSELFLRKVVAALPLKMVGNGGAGKQRVLAFF